MPGREELGAAPAALRPGAPGVLPPAEGAAAREPPARADAQAGGPGGDAGPERQAGEGVPRLRAEEDGAAESGAGGEVRARGRGRPQGDAAPHRPQCARGLPPHGQGLRPEEQHAAAAAALPSGGRVGAAGHVQTGGRPAPGPAGAADGLAHGPAAPARGAGPEAESVPRAAGLPGRRVRRVRAQLHFGAGHLESGGQRAGLPQEAQLGPLLQDGHPGRGDGQLRAVASRILRGLLPDGDRRPAPGEPAHHQQGQVLPHRLRVHLGAGSTAIPPAHEAEQGDGGGHVRDGQQGVRGVPGPLLLRLPHPAQTRQPHPQPALSHGGRKHPGHRAGAGQDGAEGAGEVQAGDGRRGGRAVLPEPPGREREGALPRRRGPDAQVGSVLAALEAPDLNGASMRMYDVDKMCISRNLN